MIVRYTATEKDAGRKVYSIMRRELMISAALTRRLKQAGSIRIGGQPVYTDRIVAPGETLELDVGAAEPACDVVPEQGPVEVLFEDGGLIAVNKPSGILTHPSRARYMGTLANFAAGYLEETAGDGRCHAVNRLDRDTSGVVLFAKNSYMKALLSDALAEKSARKEYLALVLGEMEPPSGTIDLPIARLREQDMLRVVSPNGQRAVTYYNTMNTGAAGGKAVSLLRLTLETGRTHQIRVHCHFLGHPVLGDILYHTEESRDVSALLDIAAQALHARSLTFTHPLTGDTLVIKAPEPQVFSRVANRIFPGNISQDTEY